jgi:hypothetical protein
VTAPGERRHDVHISGGRGAVVGDYATVFQVFANSPAALSSFIRQSQFRSLVDKRTKTFVGREFVFERIALVAGAEFDSGYVVVRGEPGIGKTAIAASLVASRCRPTSSRPGPGWIPGRSWPRPGDGELTTGLPTPPRWPTPRCSLRSGSIRRRSTTTGRCPGCRSVRR